MRFKFITLNIWLGGILMDNILGFLKKENPDILVCQEVFGKKDPSLDRRFRSVEVIQKELGFESASFAKTYSQKEKGIKVPRGNAVFSRFPVKKERVVFYDIPYDDNFVLKASDGRLEPRNLQQVVLDVKGISLNIFNTQGIWGFDGKDNERRLKMGGTIAKEVKGKNKVVLAGDFNMDPDTKATAKIEKHLNNVFKNELVSSFNIKRKEKPGGYAWAVADMVFVSPDIKVLNHYCPKVDVSDHFPLVCLLEV